MHKLRQLLFALSACSVLLVSGAHAQTELTEVRDTVTNSDGSAFNGTVIITWNGYANPGTVSPLSTSANIYNGALSVLLVPTTTATAGAYYNAVYNSSNGTVSWSEVWQVPPSTVPLTLALVRVSSTQGSSSSGNLNGDGSGGTQYATIPIPISEITGLSSDLATMNGSITSLTNAVTALSATVSGLGSGNTSSVAFVDAETPGGTINGTNAAFTLANAPSPASSLKLFRNGLEQTSGVDYTLSGSTLNFLSGAIPATGDLLQAYYRMAGSGPAVNFADDETPGGTINGSNLTFTLANAPNPSASLQLYQNGVLLEQNTDYRLSGSTITFVSAAVAPDTGDSLTAFYRH